MISSGNGGGSSGGDGVCVRACVCARVHVRVYYCGEIPSIRSPLVHAK